MKKQKAVAPNWSGFERFTAVLAILAVLAGLGWYLLKNDVAGTSAYTPPAGAKELFVSEGGSDLNPGTVDRPLRTLRKALELPVAATAKVPPMIINVVGAQYSVLLSDKLTPIKVNYPESLLIRGWDVANSKPLQVRMYEQSGQGGGLLSFEVKRTNFGLNYMDFELGSVDVDAAQGAKVEVGYSKFRRPLAKQGDERLTVEAWDTASLSVFRNDFWFWGDPNNAASSLGPEIALAADNHASGVVRVTSNNFYFPVVSKTDSRLSGSGLFPLIGVKLYRNNIEVAGNTFALEKASGGQTTTDRLLGVWSVFGEAQAIYDNNFAGFGGVALRVDAPAGGMGQGAKVEKNRS